MKFKITDLLKDFADLLKSFLGIFGVMLLIWLIAFLIGADLINNIGFYNCLFVCIATGLIFAKKNFTTSLYSDKPEKKVLRFFNIFLSDKYK